MTFAFLSVFDIVISVDNVATSNDQNKMNQEPVVNKELEQSLVIPEKASSFKVHPERICKDQCFYCGGKFGLYDTPCHIAQIKTTERQDKILKSEYMRKISRPGKHATFVHWWERIRFGKVHLGLRKGVVG